MILEEYALVPIGDSSLTVWKKHLNDYLSQGYVLHGGPFFDATDETIYQAVVKYEK